MASFSKSKPSNTEAPAKSAFSKSKPVAQAAPERDAASIRQQTNERASGQDERELLAYLYTHQGKKGEFLAGTKDGFRYYVNPMLIKKYDDGADFVLSRVPVAVKEV